MLPEFETRPMLSKTKRIKEYKRIHEIKEKTDAKIELKKLNKIINLSKEVKFVLNNLSHNKFKTFLKSKAEECGSAVYDVNESYTSQMCSKCGTLSEKYVNRIKECSKCKYKIDRDVNGSRNILLKYIEEVKLTA